MRIAFYLVLLILAPLGHADLCDVLLGMPEFAANVVTGGLDQITSRTLEITIRKDQPAYVLNAIKDVVRERAVVDYIDSGARPDRDFFFRFRLASTGRGILIAFANLTTDDATEKIGFTDLKWVANARAGEFESRLASKMKFENAVRLPVNVLNLGPEILAHLREMQINYIGDLIEAVPSDPLDATSESAKTNRFIASQLAHLNLRFGMKVPGWKYKDLDPSPWDNTLKIGFSGRFLPGEGEPSLPKPEGAVLEAILRTPIAILEPILSKRARDFMKNEKIHDIRALVRKTEAEVLRTPHVNRRTCSEIKSVLGSFEIGLGFLKEPEVPSKSAER